MDSMQGEGSDSIEPSPTGKSLKVTQCACYDFAPSPNQLYKDYYDLDHKALKESAKRGHCQNCIGIVKFLKSQPLEPISLAYESNHTGQMLPAFTFSDETDAPLYEYFTTKDGSAGDLRLKRSHRNPRIPRMRAPSGDTSSTEAFDTLKHWLSRCQAKHTYCQPTTDKTLPHRVLEIKSINPLSVRVVENYTLSRNYACLSHRWADKTTESISLRKENLDLYKVEVPEDRFYPLMRDAIVATFELDVRLIWIDCYCIIQDDDEDWEKEAAEMGSIYENAFFTISATSSEGGCSMFSTMAGEFEAFQVSEIRGEPVYIRKQLRHPCNVDGIDERLEGPSLTRAWVFQERMLSNRFIHFTSEEIFWECRESTWCECNSRGKEWEGRREDFPRTIDGQNWDPIPEQYNDTRLSREEDRLPAMAGVARRFAELRGGWTYLAGLWKEELPAALVWNKTAWHEPRPLKQVAPTWSWASLPRGEELMCSWFKASMRLVGYNINTPGADVYTGARWAEITVEASTLDLRVYKDADQGLIGRLENAFVQIKADFKTDPEDPEKYRMVPDGSRCLLLLIIEEDGDLSWERVWSIVLLQQNSDAGREAARFERIGISYNHSWDWYLDESGDFAEYCGGSSHPFAERERPWTVPPLQWLLDRAETRQITLV